MITKKEADTINQNYFNNNISKQKPKVSDSSDKNEITVEEANKINQNYFNQTPTVEEGSFGKSIGEFITGNEREARFNPQNLPEFSSAVVNQMSPLDPMKTPTKLGLATTFDQEAQQQIIEKQFPSAEFKDVGDGYMQIDYDGKQYVLNKAGLSTSDIESVVGTVVPFGAAARAANKLVKSSSTGIKMLAQILGQGGTEASLQGSQMLIGRENPNLFDITVAATTGGGVELAKGLGSGYRASKDFTRGGDESFNKVIQKRVDIADQASKETGVPLYRGQKTKRPSDLTQQQFALGQEGGAEITERALQVQDVASENAVENLLNKLAPSTAVETGEQGIVDRSKDVIERARLIRKEKASPLYDQAIKVENPDVNIEPIENYINDLFEELPTVGQAFDQISRIQKIIKSSKKKDSDFGSIKKLHSAKFEIDKMLKAVGDDSLDKKLQQNVLDIKDILLNQLDSASPNYKLAREIFAENTPEVERLEKSLIGSFAKYEVEDLNKVADKIFGQNQNLTNVGQVKRVKEQILSVEGGKDAWSEILRVNFERGLSKAGTNADATNTPAYLHKAIFGGTKASKKVIMEAAKGTPIAGNLRYLDIALKRAGMGRITGSPTSKFESIKKKLGGSIKPFVEALKSVTTSIASGGASTARDVAGVASETGFEKRLAELTELIFNPKWTTEMNTLKKLNSNSKEAETLMRSILKKIGKGFNKTENKALLAGQVETRRDQE
jgi:hypothetical protein